MKLILLLAIFFAAHAASDSLPDPKLTPGDTMTAPADIFCKPGYTDLVRDVSQSLKKSVYLRYGITSHKKGEYEVDHLIPLCLGGSNSILNLWPQSYTSEPWNAHKKDVLETRLRRLVCTGHINLQEAQRAMASNWIEAYKKYIEEPRKKARQK